MCKVLGSDLHFPDLLSLANSNFMSVHRVRPLASLSRGSDESFLIALNRLEEPRSRSQVMAAFATHRKPRSFSARGSHALLAAAEGDKKKPIAGAFGLDDWPGAARRPR